MCACFRRCATSTGQEEGLRNMESSQLSCLEKRNRLVLSFAASPSSTTKYALHFTRYVRLSLINSPPSQSNEVQQVSQFQITNWAPDGRSSSIKTVTDVIEEVIKVQIRTSNKPILLHCRSAPLLTPLALMSVSVLCVQ